MATPQRKAFADLPPKHQVFIYEYLHDLNATQAAIRAKYSARTAAEIGSQLLRKLEGYIEPLMKQKVAATLLSAEATMQQISMIALSEPMEAPTWRDKLFALHLAGKFHRLWDRKPHSRGLTVVFQSVRSGNDRTVTVEGRPEIEAKKPMKVEFQSIPAGKPNGKEGNGRGNGTH